LGTTHALETAISQLAHKIDEVLVLMNLEYLEIDVIDGIKTTLHLSPRALHRLHKRFTNSKIYSHRWAHVNESFRQTQADAGNLTHFDKLILRSVANNNHDDDSYLAELMKAGRSQYHSNVNEATAKIDNEANDAHSSANVPTSTVPTSAIPTSTIPTSATPTSTTQQMHITTDATQDNLIQIDVQDAPFCDSNVVRVIQPPTSQENDPYVPVNEAVAEAVRQYTALLNTMSLAAPMASKGRTASLVTSTTPTRVLFKEPPERSQKVQNQRAQIMQPQHIPEMTASL
jgi:hypothetical protein